jgi:hypothetical protein
MTSKITIIPLSEQFDGTGEKKGYKHTQIDCTEHAFLYELKFLDSIHYEIFKVRKTAVCVDFSKNVYSEDTFKERYPKKEDFGNWAWTTTDLQRAIDIMWQIETREIAKLN